MSSAIHLKHFVLPACAAVFIGAAGLRPLSAQDERSLPDLTEWYWYHGQSPQDVVDLVTADNLRITDIEVESSSPLRLSVVLVKNTGAYAKGWWWFYDQTAESLGSKLDELKARILDLEVYEDGGQLKYAAVLVPNTGADAKAWWWYLGVQPDDITTYINQNHGRITDLDTYVSGGQRYWNVVMISNTGKDASGWWWYPAINESDLSAEMTKNKSRLVDLETYTSGGDRLFAAVLVPNTGAGARDWWWYYDQTEKSLSEAVNQNGARIVDIETYFVGGEKRFAAVMLNNSNAVTTRLAHLLEYGSDGATGVFVREASGGQIAGLNEEKVFEPASTIKTLIHLHAIHSLQTGGASPQELLDWCPASSNPADPPHGCPNPPCGGQVTLNWSLEQMLWNSDNRTADAVRRRFTSTAINATAHSIGMAHTHMNHVDGCGGPIPSEMTLLDLATLYEQASGGFLDIVHQDLFYSYMTGSATSDFNGVWDATKPVIDGEGAALGLSHDQVEAFKTKTSLEYQAGNYLVQGLKYRSIGGRALLPFCVNGITETREYFFGFFIHGASGAQHADDRFDLVASEVLREEIHSALSSYSGACLPQPKKLFIRGDANIDHAVDLSDAVMILNFLFSGGPGFECNDAADANDSGQIDLSDAVTLLNFLFLGGSLPEGTTPGSPQADGTADRLGCANYPLPRRA